jgi:Domain of unknown function (DUF4388)
LSEDNLSIQGALEETTVPDLFRSLVRSGESGIVSLEANGRNDTIYFQDGRIIYAASSDPDMGLAETLLRSGELSLQQYEQAMERLLVSRRIGALLCELGYLQPDELIRANERQAHAIVLGAMSLRSGSYTIEFTSDFPPEIIPLPLSTERLILDGVRGIEYWSLVWRGIVRLSRMLEQVPGADMRTYNLELTDDETYILNLLSEPQTVEALCASSYLNDFVTCRTVWGLLAVNFIQDAAEGEAIVEKRAAVESEYELEEIVERYNTLFQTIFGIVFQKIGDHTYDFIDRVLLHLSPDTMPYLSGMNLVNEARIDFDQLYNNLIASGSQDHAAVVHNVLNELLTGWIFEIKTEFGPGLEAEVVALAKRMRDGAEG